MVLWYGHTHDPSRLKYLRDYPLAHNATDIAMGYTGGIRYNGNYGNIIANIWCVLTDRVLLGWCIVRGCV